MKNGGYTLTGVATLLACLLALGAVVDAQAEVAYKITSVTLTGPSVIYCPPNDKATYTVTLVGTGQPDNASDSWPFFTPYDDDGFISDDMMQKEEQFWIRGDGTGTGNWTKTLSFQLWCEDHEIRGAYESSGEGTLGDPAEIYVLIEDWSGWNLTTSNTIEVECRPGPPPVAEPVSFLLAGLGLSAVAAVRRKR